MTAYRSVFLAGAAAIALSASAQAAPKTAQSDPRIGILEQQLRDVQQQLAQIKGAQPADYSDAVIDLKRSTSAHYVDINSRLDAQHKASVDNGRLSIASPDGRFTAAIRGLFQYDTGYYSQGRVGSLLPAAYGNDFGSGSNFRRVYLGLSGKVFGDWSYNLNFDFGGSGGTETPGRIQSVYLQYDGLAPFAFRIGAFPPPASIEDATTPGDTLFLERNSPADLQRNIAGGDGRDGISVIYAAPTLFGAVSYTGDKVADGTKAFAAAGATATANFDEQQAVVGRLAWLPVSTPNAHWLIGANGTYIIKTPDLVAGGLPNAASNPINGATPGVVGNSITLSDPPEFTFDSNGYNLITTGALNARHISQWGVETAGNWGSLYAQAGYFGFNVQRTQVAYLNSTGVTQFVTPNDNNFSAWYAQASWILTGEQRVYNPATASFGNPKVAEPFSLDKGQWGAFELTARYSDTNLNDRVNDSASVQVANAAGAAAGTRTFAFYNTVRGGDQRVATVGLNWFPNNVIKFALNYEYIQNTKLQSGASPNALTGVTLATTGTNIVPPTLNGGQNLSAIALRAQLGL